MNKERITALLDEASAIMLKIETSMIQWAECIALELSRRYPKREIAWASGMGVWGWEIDHWHGEWDMPLDSISGQSKYVFRNGMGGVIQFAEISMFETTMSDLCSQYQYECIPVGVIRANGGNILQTIS